MKKQNILMVAGLVILSAGLIMHNFASTPHFLNGFAIGLGGTLVVGGFILPKLKRKMS